MADDHYVQSAQDLKNWLEDNGKQAVETEDELTRALYKSLYVRYLSRNVAGYVASEAAFDDAEAIVRNLDTLRPVLEHYWRNH